VTLRFNYTLGQFLNKIFLAVLIAKIAGLLRLQVVDTALYLKARLESLNLITLSIAANDKTYRLYILKSIDGGKVVLGISHSKPFLWNDQKTRMLNY
jgi:hypothetical protein